MSTVNVVFRSGLDPVFLLASVHEIVSAKGERMTAEDVATVLHNERGVEFVSNSGENPDNSPAKQIDRLAKHVGMLISSCEPSFLNVARGINGGIGTGAMLSPKKEAKITTKDLMAAAGATSRKELNALMAKLLIEKAESSRKGSEAVAAE